MRSLDFARNQGRECRQALGDAADGLLDRLEAFLQAQSIDLVPMNPEQMQGSKAEIDTDDGIITYDKKLSDSELLEVLAHELGHLTLHKRLGQTSMLPDPVLASAYAEAGPATLARYSPRVREEAEANAFAMEFLCPSVELLEHWRNDAQATIASLANNTGVTDRVVRVQLANALYDLALNRGGSATTHTLDVTFTSEQTAAACHLGTAALVDAGPGTGKTAALIRRIRFLLEERKASSSQMLILTFSNEAAQELRERISSAFGTDVADGMTISTFHGFGMELMHYHGGLAGYAKDPMLLDEDAQAEIVYDLLGQVPCPTIFNLSNPWETAAKVAAHINHCKHRLILPADLALAIAAGTADYGPRGSRAGAEEVHALYQVYENMKREAGRVDFADLILIPLRLLENHDDLRAGYQQKYPWILVDEYQDVSRATARLLQALCGEQNPPWVVGDARQAIYQFLGASPDNVRHFKEDFPDANVFDLSANYRSSQPIIAVANELAALLEDPDATTAHERWSRATTCEPLGSSSVAMAEAESDYAEQQGVVQQIQEWIGREGVSPGDIAVLARRHVDVRRIMLALTDAGIKAQAAGLLTAEGAAGDLAAVLTLEEAPFASIPRLAFALGRKDHVTVTVNETVRELLQVESGNSETNTVGTKPNKALTKEIGEVRKQARRDRFSSDGFDALTAFLFDSSRYLRRVLEAPESAERAVTLIEIVSVLSLATSYRATHPGVAPKAARLGFAERLRFRLTETIPLPIVPRPRADAVRVMTCHSSKGLEFPCVIVSGQTVPTFPEPYPWLPPSLRPGTNEDREQANALLFVGVTRAKRAITISYPLRANEGSKREKHIVPLAALWRDRFNVPVKHWNFVGGGGGFATVGAVWGSGRSSAIKPSALDTGFCPILAYLEQLLGIRFPEEEIELYPVVFGTVRRVLRVVAERTNASGRQLSDTEVGAVFDEVWPPDRHHAHPHFTLYRDAGISMARAFARVFRPIPGTVLLDPQMLITHDDRTIPVQLDLIAHFQQPDGLVVAITFRPESLAKDAREGKLKWSGLSENKRISLLLLENATPGVLPLVFSGKDEVIYDYQPSQQKQSLPKQTEALLQRHRAFSNNDFSAEITEYKCDGCRARVSCPYWLQAIQD